MRKILVLLLLTACSPSSLKECRKEGEVVIDRLCHELALVRSRDEFMERRSNIEVHVVHIARLMQKVQGLKGEVRLDDPFEKSQALQAEVERIFRIEGVRDAFEEMQRDVLVQFNLDSK